ncbi:MAG: radical SAM protein [Candidatus Sumerlaeota bacterium]|nr:radical SAM protein [Candidatus Sumerlaeota bacterium]
MDAHLASWIVRYLPMGPEMMQTYHRARGRRRFLRLFLDTTNNCNLKCRMCYFAAEHEPIQTKYWSREEFERLAVQVAPHARLIAFSCGTEPLLNPGIEAFVRLAKRFGVPETQLVTNGQMLTSQRSRGLIEAGLDRLVVSLDAATPETYEFIRPGARFQRLLDHLKAFRDARGGRPKPGLTLNFILMKCNRDEVEAFMRLAAELGADTIDFRHLTPYVELGFTSEMRLSDDPSTRSLIPMIQRLGGELSLRLIPDVAILAAGETTDRCMASPEQVFIPFDGGVRACPAGGAEPFGNVFKDSFWDIWRSERFEKVRQSIQAGNPPEECKDCPMRMLRERASKGAHSIKQ